MSTDAAVSAQNPPDERLAAIFANQRRWLLRMAAPARGVVTHAAGLTTTCARYDGAIVLPVGRPVSGAALDAAFDAIRRPAPPGGVLVWSATGDEPLRTALARRLLARGCDEAFRPRWMERDLAATAESDAGHPAPDSFGVSPAESGDELAIAAAAEVGTPYASPHEATALINHGRLPANRQRMWLLLARDRSDGRVVGQVAVNLTTGRRGIAGIYSMGVHPTVQRRGIGTALIRAAADLARQHGVAVLGLNATPDGERLYRTLGFSVVTDGQTWHMPAARLASTPNRDAVDLAEAIAGGTIPDVERLAASVRTPPRLPNADTPLAFAARFGQTAAARWLVDHGAPPEVTSFWTLGWRDEARALMGDPTRLNARSGPDRLTPLHEAIYHDDRELTTLLLASGADLTATDTRYGGTPLSWAKALARASLIPLLEQAGEEQEQPRSGNAPFPPEA